MGIGANVVRELLIHDHDATHLIDGGFERLPDQLILEKARSEGRVIHTHDLDFGDLLAAGGYSSPSVITFRLSNMRSDNVLQHLLPAILEFAMTWSPGPVARSQMAGLDAGNCHSRAGDKWVPLNAPPAFPARGAS
jgi:predicted nuclease of predicted toxin-antitoxin system